MVTSRFRGSQELGSQSGPRSVRVRIIVFMEVALLVEGVVPIRPDESVNILSFFALEVYHAPESICAKDDALQNISSMLVTLDTSHLAISTLNDDAE